MDANKTPLSKSLILSHRQCPRRAWLEAKGVTEPVYSRSALMLQAQGQEVHAAGRSLFPGAQRIPASMTLEAAAVATDRAITSGAEAIIEAGFVAGDLGVRLDVLQRGTTGWRIVEIKSGSEVKDEYLTDCAIQYHCATQAGLNVEGVDVMRTSTALARPAGGTGAEILVRESVSDTVHYRAMAVPGWAAACRATLDGDEPMVKPGAQCEDPQPCPYSGRCGKVEESKETDCVEFLPSHAKPVSGYIEDGATKITELPNDAFEHPRNALVRLAVVLGRAVVTEELAEAIRSLPYPRHYLDFEAVAFAVPRFDGMRAYQAVPFQFSNHREDGEDSELVHSEFLDVSGNDPRRPFAVALLEALGTDGPVLVFSAYEKTRLRELAVLFPDLRDAIMRVVDRLVDLLPMARKGYYHPDMRGSWSLKKIAPTLPKVAGTADYSELEDVADGMEAQAAYYELTDKTLIGLDREALIGKMLAYCGTDTAGLHRFTSAMAKANTDRIEPFFKPKKAAKKGAVKVEAAEAVEA